MPQPTLREEEQKMPENEPMQPAAKYHSHAPRQDLVIAEKDPAIVLGKKDAIEEGSVAKKSKVPPCPNPIG